MSFGLWYVSLDIVSLNLERYSTDKGLHGLAALPDKALTVDWDQSSAYTDHNLTKQAYAWDAIDIDRGIVTVDKEWALAKGLPLGFEFPWDETKAVYLMNSYHSLHCIVSFLLNP